MSIDKDKARASFKEAVDAFDWSWAEAYAGDRAPGEPHRFAHEAFDLVLAIEEPVAPKVIRECVLVAVTDESDVVILVTPDEKRFAQKVIGGEVVELTRDEVFFPAPVSQDDLKTSPTNDPVTITEPAPPPDAPLGNNPSPSGGTGGSGPIGDPGKLAFDQVKAKEAFEKAVDALDWEFALTQFLALHKQGAPLTVAEDGGPPTIESLKAGAELAFAAASSLGGLPVEVTLCPRFAVGVAEAAGGTRAVIGYTLQPDLPQRASELAFVTKDKNETSARPLDLEKWKKPFKRGQDLDW